MDGIAHEMEPVGRALTQRKRSSVHGGWVGVHHAIIIIACRLQRGESFGQVCVRLGRELSSPTAVGCRWILETRPCV